MFGVKDPDEMTAKERIRELAGILARGYLRLLKKAPYQGDSAHEPEDDNGASADISNG